MKNTFLMTILIATTALCSGELQARPGGRGGGGGGGGPGPGFRPSAPSAPVTRPARPAQGPRPGTLPANGPGVRPGNHGIDPAGPGAIRPRPGTLPANPGGRPGAGDVGRFLGQQPAGSMPGTAGYRPGYTGYHRAEVRPLIPGHFPYHPVLGYPFGRPWLNSVGWRYDRWPVWTIAATGAAVARWIGFNNYGGYGSSEAVPYYPVEAAPADVYEEQVSAPAELVASGSAAPVADDSEWLNLGTFGFIPPQQKDMTLSVQLAITKDGMVRGLELDFKTNLSREVEGSIDPATLRIAWQAKGIATAPYFETNLDQLTQEESLVNVYDPMTKVLISWQSILIEETDLPPRN